MEGDDPYAELTDFDFALQRERSRQLDDAATGGPEDMLTPARVRRIYSPLSIMRTPPAGVGTSSSNMLREARMVLQGPTPPQIQRDTLRDALEMTGINLNSPIGTSTPAGVGTSTSPLPARSFPAGVGVPTRSPRQPTSNRPWEVEDALARADLFLTNTRTPILPNTPVGTPPSTTSPAPARRRRTRGRGQRRRGTTTTSTTTTRAGRGRDRRQRRRTEDRFSSDSSVDSPLSGNDLQQQLQVLLNDQRQTAAGRRIAGITTTNTITTTYKDGGVPTVSRSSSRVSG